MTRRNWSPRATRSGTRDEGPPLPIISCSLLPQQNATFVVLTPAAVRIAGADLPESTPACHQRRGIAPGSGPIAQLTDPVFPPAVRPVIGGNSAAMAGPGTHFEEPQSTGDRSGLQPVVDGGTVSQLAASANVKT